MNEEIVKWQQKCKFFENEMIRLTELNELYAKK
jgi:hypothetical protein